jgi:hypothetical protein
MKRHNDAQQLRYTVGHTKMRVLLYDEILIYEIYEYATILAALVDGIIAVM